MAANPRIAEPVADVVVLSAPVIVPAGGLALTDNFLWTLAGNVMLAGCQWGVLIVIAKLGNPSMVGDFALALALTAPIMLLTSQGLRALLATDSRQQIRFQEYLGYRLATSLLGFLAICCFLKASNQPLLVIIVGASKALDTVSDIIYGLFQAHDRLDRSAISMTAKGILSLALVAVLMMTGSILWAVSGMAFASLIVLLSYDVPVAVGFLRSANGGIGQALKLVRPSFTKKSFRKLAILGFPLGIAAFLNSLSTNMPRYSLEHYAGAAVLGIFAANSYLVAAGNTLVNALAQSSVAQLARSHVNRQKMRFSSLLYKQVAFAAVLGLGGVMVSVIWGPSILRLLYKPEYAKFSNVFVLSMIAAGLSYIAAFGGTALTAVRSITVQPFILGATTVVTQIMCWLWIPQHGIVGAAWALVGSNGFQMLAMFAALFYAMARTDRTSLQTA
jgi:O-antigen/teichoic acid export membrane protein